MNAEGYRGIASGCFFLVLRKSDVPAAHVSNFGILQIQVLGVDEEVVGFPQRLFLRHVDRAAHCTRKDKEVQLAGLVEIERVEHADIQESAGMRVDNAREKNEVDVLRHRDLAFGKLRNLSTQEVVPMMIESQKADFAIETCPTNDRMCTVPECCTDSVQPGEVGKDP